jgi:hypothetical protein
MEYLLTGVKQSENIRSYAFAEVDRDLRQMSFTVAVDISLLRKYAIPLQELPLLCRHFLEEQRKAGSNQNLIFGEAEMVQYSRRRSNADRAEEARKAQRNRKFHPPEKHE